MVKVALRHTYVVRHMMFVQHSLGGTVCMVIRSCSWSNDFNLVLQLGSGVRDREWYFDVIDEGVAGGR